MELIHSPWIVLSIGTLPALWPLLGKYPGRNAALIMVAGLVPITGLLHLLMPSQYVSVPQRRSPRAFSKGQHLLNYESAPRAFVDNCVWTSSDPVTTLGNMCCYDPACEGEEEQFNDLPKILRKSFLSVPWRSSSKHGKHRMINAWCNERTSKDQPIWNKYIILNIPEL